MLRTKIVCTIGPASRAPEMLRELMLAGMDVARLNFSHGDQSFHGENIQRIRAVAAEVGKPIAILTDLQGPKLRVGKMEGEGVLLVSGEKVTLNLPGSFPGSLTDARQYAGENKQPQDYKNRPGNTSDFAPL